MWIFPSTYFTAWSTVPCAYIRSSPVVGLQRVCGVERGTGGDVLLDLSLQGGALPPGNLVSALIALVLLRAQDAEELTDAFTAWTEQVLLPRPLRGTALASLPRLEAVRTMLAETVREWTEQGRVENARCRVARRRASSTRRPGGSWPPRWPT